MTLTLIVLTLCTFLGGASVSIFKTNPKDIKNLLVFAGSFLFSITIIHILPEIFVLTDRPMVVGLWVLAGFFLQQILEYFTAGVEHGHFHARGDVSASFKITVLCGLIVHSLLEGALLTHDSPFHDKHESHSLLLGIVLHKIPAAFALMATLRGNKRITATNWLMLLIFSIASPIGLILSDQILSLSENHLLYLFGVVSGAFLHISTTIFVESSPEHRFGLRKLAISLTGAGLAIAVEYLV